MIHLYDLYMHTHLLLYKGIICMRDTYIHTYLPAYIHVYTRTHQHFCSTQFYYYYNINPSFSTHETKVMSQHSDKTANSSIDAGVVLGTVSMGKRDEASFGVDRQQATTNVETSMRTPT